MDPVSVLQVAGFAGSAAKGAIEVAQDLYVFCNEVKHVDQTVHGLATEVQALGSACALVDERLREIITAHDLSSSTGATKGRLWRCIELQVIDSRRTIEQLKLAFEDVREQGTNVLGQAWRQIKLNMRTKDIAETRNRIRSHTASLQMVLQTVAIEVCYVAPQKADQQLQTLLVKAEQCVEHLKQLRAQSTEQDSDQQAREDEMIAVSEETLSNGESLYAASVANGSMLGDPGFAGRASHVHDWIQDVSAIERTTTALSAIAETDLHSTVSTEEHSIVFSEDPLRRESTAPTSVAPNDHHKDIHDPEGLMSDCEYDSEDDFLVDAAKEALDTGRTSFRSQEYEDASEYLQEALKIVRELPARSQALVCNVWEIRYLLSVCAYHTQSLIHAKTSLWTVVEHASRASLQNNDQRKQCCEAGHLLSIVCLKLGSLEEARQYCESALKGRHKLFGKSHPESFRSLALLARILSIQGHQQRAKIYSRMIPESERETYTKEFEELSAPTIPLPESPTKSRGIMVRQYSCVPSEASEDETSSRQGQLDRRPTLSTQADSTDSAISMSYEEHRHDAHKTSSTSPDDCVAFKSSSPHSPTQENDLKSTCNMSSRICTEPESIAEPIAAPKTHPSRNASVHSNTGSDRHVTLSQPQHTKSVTPKKAAVPYSRFPGATRTLPVKPLETQNLSENKVAATESIITRNLSTGSSSPMLSPGTQAPNTFLKPENASSKSERTPSPDDRTSIASFQTAFASPRPTRTSSFDDRASTASSSRTASTQDERLLNSILNRTERREISDLLPKMRDLDQSLSNICKRIGQLEKESSSQSMPEKLIIEIHAAEWALGKARRYAYGSRRPSARLEYETAKKSTNSAEVLLKEYESLPEKQRLQAAEDEFTTISSPTSSTKKSSKFVRLMSIRGKSSDEKPQDLEMSTTKGDIKFRLLDDAKAFKPFSQRIQNGSFTNSSLHVAARGIEARNSARECSFIITPPPTRLTDANDALLGYVVNGLDVVQEMFEAKDSSEEVGGTRVVDCRFERERAR